MNNPKLIANVKLLFHALTVASAALAAIGGFIPPKYALYATLVASAISGALHLLTRIFPEIAAQESA